MPNHNSLVHTSNYWVFRLYVDNDTIGAVAPAGDQYQLQVEHVTVIGDNNYVVRYDWTGTGYSTFKAINSIFGWPSAFSFCSRNKDQVAAVVSQKMQILATSLGAPSDEAIPRAHMPRR